MPQQLNAQATGSNLQSGGSKEDRHVSEDCVVLIFWKRQARLKGRQRRELWLHRPYPFRWIRKRKGRLRRPLRVSRMLLQISAQDKLNKARRFSRHHHRPC